MVPPLPGKALKRQLPFRGDEGIFEEGFIEERRIGLEQFINRFVQLPCVMWLANEHKLSEELGKVLGFLSLTSHHLKALHLKSSFNTIGLMILCIHHTQMTHAC